jgi:uncharacterized lipoprotein YmbA
MNHSFSQALLLSAAALLLGACAGSPPSSFYLLTPMSVAPAAPGSGLIVGVGPVRLADYLDRPQIVAREVPNRLQVSEVHRWGGSLQDNLLLVLTQNLSLLLGAEQVLVYPWDDPLRPDYQVRMEVRRFDGSPDAEVELDARWSIEAADAAEAGGKGRSLIREAVGGTEVTDLVAAQSRALERLSRDIAAEIERLEQVQAKRE